MLLKIDMFRNNNFGDRVCQKVVENR
jgi:hypothetical protein